VCSQNRFGRGPLAMSAIPRFGIAFGSEIKVAAALMEKVKTG
jgi:hypothetical protein